MEGEHVAGSYVQVAKSKVRVVLGIQGQYNIRRVLSGLPPPGEPRHRARATVHGGMAAGV